MARTGAAERRTGRTLVGLAAACVVGWTLARWGGIVGPVVLAMVITICVEPVRTLLVRLGVPRGLATVAVLLTVLVAFVLFVYVLILSVDRFVAIFPRYGPEIQSGISAVSSWTDSLGLDSSWSGALARSLSPTAVVAWVSGVAGSALSVGAGVIAVLSLIVMMSLDAIHGRPVLRGMARRRPDLVRALVAFFRGVRRYMVVTAALGAAVAIIDGIALSLLHIPGALLWAVLAFLTGFIPNIGFWIGLLPPVVLALLADGWATALLVLVLYIVINATFQSFIQTNLIGSVVALSRTLTFLSVIVWTAILGPIGAILAIPLTLLVRCLLLDADPASRWLKPLTGDYR